MLQNHDFWGRGGDAVGVEGNVLQSQQSSGGFVAESAKLRQLVNPSLQCFIIFEVAG